MTRLPEWNDLTNDQREAVVKVVAYNVGGTDAQYYDGQIALEVYEHIRLNIPVELPPLIAPLHAIEEPRRTPAPVPVAAQSEGAGG